MESTRVIAVRHGETVANQAGRFQGQSDSPLSAAGLAQSRAVGQRLVHFPVAALYSSDLGRAMATARLVAEATGLEVTAEPRLRERHLGVFQGLTKDEAAARFPAENVEFRKGTPDYVLPGGESMQQSLDRFAAFLGEAAVIHAGRTIVAITHGGVLSTFLRHVLGLPLDAPRRYKRLNASLNVFARERGRWYLETWGDVAHLQAGASLDDV